MAVAIRAALCAGAALGAARPGQAADPAYYTVADGVVLKAQDYDGQGRELISGVATNESITYGRAYTAAGATVTLRNISARGTTTRENRAGWHDGEQTIDVHGGAFVVESDAVLTLDSVAIQNVEVNASSRPPFGSGTGTGTTASVLGTDGADAFGGAIFVRQGGSLTIIDGLISGNRAVGTADGEGYGQGIFFPSGSGARAPVIQASPGGQTLIEDEIADDGAGVVGIVVGDPAGINTGTVVLSASNHFAGGTTLAPGVLSVADFTALGSGGLTMDEGILRFAAAGMDLSRAVTLDAGGGTFDSNGSDAILSGTVSGSGFLVKTGDGSLTVTAANDYTGGTKLSLGTLRAGNPSAFGSGPLTVEGGLLDLAGHGVTVTGLAGGGGTIDPGSGVLTMDQSGDSSFAGAIVGSGSLIKRGTGTLTLSGDSIYSGGTAVEDGTLKIEGSFGSGPVTVADGAVIAGSGSLGGLLGVASGGILAPGSSPGTLTVTRLSLGASAILDFELGNPGALPGVTSDRVTVTDDLTLDGRLRVTDAGGFAPGSYTLFTYGGALTDNTLEVASLPGGYNGEIDSSSGGRIDLVVHPGTDGACGAAQNGGPWLEAPDAELCTTGTPTAVTTASNRFAWDCQGSDGGSTSACSAVRGYQVSPYAAAGGSLSPGTPQTVAYNGELVLTVVPEPGFGIDTVEGCGGSLTDTTFTTAPIIADCSVTASFRATAVPLLSAWSLALLSGLLGLFGLRVSQRRGV